MHNCPYCGYEFQEFEQICPRCQKEQQKTVATRASKGRDKPEPKPKVRTPRRALVSVGARTGACYGAIVMALITLFDRLAVVGWNPDILDNLMALALSAVVGLVLGALTGIGIAYSGSPELGIIGSALVIGIPRGWADYFDQPTRALWRPRDIPYTALALGAVYGIIFGVTVAYFVNRAIQRRIALTAKLNLAEKQQTKQQTPVASEEQP